MFVYSGLDSTSSLLVLEALRKVAEKGRLTVVCVIHQPRYEIYSKLLIVGPEKTPLNLFYPLKII